MSDCFKPTCYNNKAKNLHWINTNYQIHDLLCHCDNPPRHLLLAIAERNEPILVSKEEKRKVLQCLTTSEDATITTTGDADGVDEIGLDAFFAEDMQEDG
nr:MAG TPA: TT viral ORF2 [Anelloviridae sp.]